MQTCSNCGAAARPGAKFCTSCGARLPIVQTSEGAGWGTNGDQPQPASPWGTVPSNGQQAPSSPGPVTVAASAASDQPEAATNDAPGGASSAPWGQSGGDQGETSDAGASARSGAGQSSSSWTWGQPPTDDTAQDDSASAPAQDGEESDTASGAQPNWISGWTSASTETSTSDQNDSPDMPPAASPGDSGWPAASAGSDKASTETDAATVANAQPGDDTADPDARPEWMRNLEASNQATAGAAAPDQTGVDFFAQTTEAVEESTPATSQDASDTATAPATASVPDSTPDGDAGTGSATQAGDVQAASADETAVPAATSGVVGPDGTSSDALTEAQGLLDRLRDLLPALAAPAAAAPSVNTNGIADQLQQAIDQNAKPEFDDLRSVLEAAKERPRDVDTMLNLVAKIDPMLDLLHAHGNLLTAISTVVTQLRDQNSG